MRNFRHFRPFCDIIADMKFIAAYYAQLRNIMQHYMPIKLWSYRRKNGRSRR